MRLRTSRLRASRVRLALWAIAGIAATVCPGPAWSHEFWIEPSTFTPAAGRQIAVALRVGTKFNGEPVERREVFIDRFAALVPTANGAAKETPITGDDEDEPAGKISAAQAGPMILIYDSKQSYIELDGDKFTAYLVEKGLDDIQQLRANAGKRGDTARELYSRCAKAILQVDDHTSSTRGGDNKNDAGKAGTNPSPAPDRYTGMPLELVAEFDPYAEPAVRKVTCRVLFNGRPLSRALVTARSKQNPAKLQFAHSDDQGRVRFDLDNAGPWLIDCTHMIPWTLDADADYESFWASLTFEVPHADSTTE